MGNEILSEGMRGEREWETGKRRKGKGTVRGKGESIIYDSSHGQARFRDNSLGIPASKLLTQWQLLLLGVKQPQQNTLSSRPDVWTSVVIISPFRF